jgi:hypothetical protein
MEPEEDHVDDQLLYKIITPPPIHGDLATTISKTGTSIVHAPATTISSVLMSSFPALLVHGRSSSALLQSKFTALALSPTSSVMFFANKLETGGAMAGGRRAAKNFSFLVHFSQTSPTELSFRTIARRELANLGAPELLGDIFRAMADAAKKHAGDAADTEVQQVAGTVSLFPQQFNCTRIVLSASITVPRTRLKTPMRAGSVIDSGASGRDSSLFGTSGRGSLLSIRTLRRASSTADTSELTPAAAGNSEKEKKKRKKKKKKKLDDRGILILDHLMSAVSNLHTKFARHAEVDQANRDHFATVLVPTSPPPAAYEKALHDKAKSFLTSVHNRGTPTSLWKRVKGTIKESVAYYNMKVTGDSAWALGVADVDTSAERALSWLWSTETCENFVDAIGAQGPGAFLRTLHLPDSHSMLHSFLTPLSFGLNDRIFSLWFSWERDESGELRLAFAPMDECPERDHVTAMKKLIDQDPRASRATKGTITGLYQLKPRGENICRVTLVSQAKLGGQVPTALMDMKIKSSLSVLKNLQFKYDRNWRVVDAEVNASQPHPPTFEKLTEEQKKVVEDCRAMEVSFNSDHSVQLLKPFSPFVDTWMGHALVPTAGGAERSVTVGKAVCVADCPAREAANWWFDYCSKERSRKSEEQQNPARLIIKETTPHDFVAATVKKMPFPLHSREFVGRQLRVVDDQSGVFFVYSVPATDKIDYGANLKTKRGEGYFLAKFEPLDANQCRVAIIANAETRGLSNSVIALRFGSTLQRNIDACRARFQRDDEVDKEERDRKVQIMRDDAQVYTPEENEVLQEVQSDFGGIVDEEFKHVDSPDDQVHMGLQFFRGGASSSGVSRATAVLDASIEECAALEWELTARKRTAINFETGSRERNVTKRNEHSSIFRAVYDLGVPGFLPREFLLSQVWSKLDEDTIVIARTTVELPDEYPIDPKKYVRGFTKVFWKFARLPCALGGVDQTRATWTQQADLMGVVPKRFIKSSVVNLLMHLSETRERFDRSLSIDGLRREMNIDMIKNHAAAYSEEENEFIDGGMNLIKLFKKEGAKKAKAPSSSVKFTIASNPGTEDSYAYGAGRCDATIRATKEQVLSFLLDSCARCRWDASYLDFAVLETKNDHHFVACDCKKGVHAAGANVLPMETVSSSLWKRQASDTLVFVTSPTDHRLKPRSGIGRALSGQIGRIVSEKMGGIVSRQRSMGSKPPASERTRLMMWSSLTIKETSPGVCKIVYVNKLEVGAGLRSYVLGKVSEGKLALAYKMQLYFQNLRKLEQWDVEDGKAVGEILVTRTKAEKLHEKSETRIEARMRSLFKKNKGLDGIDTKYEFFQSMMAGVVQNNLRPAADVKTKLINLSSRDGRTIGAGLALSLATNLTSEAAVDEWISNYPALREVDREEDWFRPMLTVMATRLLGEVSWGLKLRVSVGAGLSTLDLFSDVNVMLLYLGTLGQKTYGLILLGMLGANILLMLFFVILQNKSRPSQLLLREAALVLTGLKPA